MDQSNRYADLSLKEEDLIKGGKHILVAYKMKPKARLRLPGSRRALRRRVLHRHQRRSLHHRRLHQGRRRAGLSHRRSHRGHAHRLSDRPVRPQHHRRPHDDGVLPDPGHRQQPGHGRHRARQDARLLRAASACIQLFDGPAKDISDLWRILGRPVKDGGYIAGTIIKPKLGLRPEPFAKAAYQFWLGGDFIKNDEPQGNQVFCPIKKVIPLVYDAMKRAMDETGQAKLFSANITADDHYEMLRPRRFHPGNLRPGCRQGGLPGRRLRRRPRHDHHRPSPVPQPVPALPPRRPRRGHLAAAPSAATPPSCWPRCRRLQGASGIHVGTMGYGKMEGEQATTASSPT